MACEGSARDVGGDETSDAETVEKTRERSGWTISRILEALGLPRSVYYAWWRREDRLEDASPPGYLLERAFDEMMGAPKTAQVAAPGKIDVDKQRARAAAAAVHQLTEQMKSRRDLHRHHPMPAPASES